MTLAFPGDVWYHSIALAGVMELVDVTDSKSTTPFHAAVLRNLDLSRVFDNLIWIRFLMSLQFLGWGIGSGTLKIKMPVCWNW